MLGFRSATEGSAGYVAMEKVTAKLGGRSDSFVLQHVGTMTISATQAGTDRSSGESAAESKNEAAEVRRSQRRTTEQGPWESRAQTALGNQTTISTFPQPQQQGYGYNFKWLDVRSYGYILKWLDRDTQLPKSANMFRATGWVPSGGAAYRSVPGPRAIESTSTFVSNLRGPRPE